MVTSGNQTLSASSVHSADHVEWARAHGNPGKEGGISFTKGAKVIVTL
jgi:hypothetical protein